MSIEFMFRIIGMFIFSLMGAYLGVYVANTLSLVPLGYGVIFGLLGSLFGLIMTPFLTTRPMRLLRSKLMQLSAQTLTAGVVGLTAGLIVAALLSFPLSLLPPPLGQLFPFASVLIFGYFGVAIFILRQNDLFSVLRAFPGRAAEESSGEAASAGRSILLDTSVIIDGRIADIAMTGFLSGILLIPRFVLNELQYIADSPDSLRRQRGRRGMEVLARLQKDTAVPVRISDIDVEGVREVDDKLVVLARQLRCPILTNDYNLNRIAELQGVAVLNVNELASSVKLVLLPGEQLHIKLIQDGKEAGQGVGYLDDGTMVVVEDGRGSMNREVGVTVTKVLQTAAGRMIFARMEND